MSNVVNLEANALLGDLLNNWQKHDIHCIYGGRKSGKGMAVWQLTNILLEQAPAPMRVCICRAKRSEITEGAHVIFQSVFRDMGLRHRWKVTQTSLKHVNGHRVFYKGLNIDPGSSRGLEEPDIVIVDEAQYVSDAGWREVEDTFIRGQKPVKLIVIMNPRYPNDPVARYYLGNDFQGTGRPEVAIYRQNYTDNRFWNEQMERSRIALLEREGQLVHDHVYGGTWDVTSLHNPFGDADKIYRAFTREVLHPGDEVWVAVDVAFTENLSSDYTVCLAGDAYGNITRWDRFKLENPVPRIAGFAKGLPIVIDATGAGSVLARSLADYGSSVEPVVWNSALKEEMIRATAELLGDDKLTFVAAGMEWLIEELLHYERVTTKAGQPTNKFGAEAGYHDDGVSALMMYAHKIWQPYKPLHFLSNDSYDDYEGDYFNMESFGGGYV